MIPWWLNYWNDIRQHHMICKATPSDISFGLVSKLKEISFGISKSRSPQVKMLCGTVLYTLGESSIEPTPSGHATKPQQVCMNYDISINSFWYISARSSYSCPVGQGKNTAAGNIFFSIWAFHNGCTCGPSIISISAKTYHFRRDRGSAIHLAFSKKPKRHLQKCFFMLVSLKVPVQYVVH